jgi:hypothetical protein
MALTRPTVLPVWADTGDKTQPTDGEIAVGWPVTSIPPSRQRFNWFFNWVSNGVRYLTRRGIPDWVETEPYKIGDRQQSLVNGKTYVSIVDDNINFEPSANPAKWERWGFSLSDLFAFLLSNHGGNCPVTGPAAAPTAGNPYTKYTSVAPYLENWEWTATTGWKVTSNHYESPMITAASTALAGGNNLVHTAPLPRKGKIFVFAYSHIPAGTAATHTVLVQVPGGAVHAGPRSVATSGVEPISTMGITLNVDTDTRNLLLYAYPALAGAPSHATYMKYQYID